MGTGEREWHICSHKHNHTISQIYIEMIQQQRVTRATKIDNNQEKPNEPKMTPKADALN